MGIEKPEAFSFDDGLAEQRALIFTMVKPILAALIHLEFPLMTKGKGKQTPKWSGRCWRMLWFCWTM